MQHRPNQSGFRYITVHSREFTLKIEEVLVQHRLLIAGYGTNFVVKYTHRTQPILVLKKTPVP